ncbi:MAG: AraC family transcriptional regulator [Lachnospiraceae bacterium]|nr:AraC family transcriptional regulator [Lachnospiraceae bacterium]
MARAKHKMEFRYYDIPKGEYVMAKLGKGWEQEYGLGYGRMLHFHNYMEIGYCYHGDGELLIEDRTYKYGDNMFTIIPANIPHTTISAPGNICKWEFLFINMDEFVTDMFRGGGMAAEDVLRIINKRGTLKTKENHPVQAKLVLDIIRECREQPLYYKESIKGYLYSLAVEILRLDEEREQAKRANKVNTYIKDAITYIHDHYREEIKISEVADGSGLSETHFRRLFEEVMNMKPVEYINLVRIDHACNLIEKENLSMEDVCYRVGYQTPSTFNRNFKRLTGLTPYQWRGREKLPEGHRTNYNISAQPGWEGIDFVQ